MTRSADGTTAAMPGFRCGLGPAASPGGPPLLLLLRGRTDGAAVTTVALARLLPGRVVEVLPADLAALARSTIGPALASERPDLTVVLGRARLDMRDPLGNVTWRLVLCLARSVDRRGAQPYSDPAIGPRGGLGCAREDRRR